LWFTPQGHSASEGGAISACMTSLPKYDAVATDTSEEIEQQRPGALRRMPVVVGVCAVLGVVAIGFTKGMTSGRHDMTKLVTEERMISLAEEDCEADGSTDCMESRCCQNPEEKCYLKNQHWASCKKTCDPDETDPYDNLKWDCTELNKTTSLQCSKDHEDCRANPKCCNADFICYVKDGDWANCNADCVQGDGANSYDTGSYSCEIHEFDCATITNSSDPASKDTAQKLLKCCQDQYCDGSECTGDKVNRCTFYEKKMAQASLAAPDPTSAPTPAPTPAPPA